MVIPIMLFMICGFIGLMLQVELQQQLDAATKLAAESTFQAPRSFHDCGGGSSAACPSSGLPTRCRYAMESFEGTMDFYGGGSPGSGFNQRRNTDPMLQFKPVVLCKTDTGSPPPGGSGSEPTSPDPGSPFTDPPPSGASAVGPNPVSDIRCDIDYQDPAVSGLRVTYCDSWVTLDYSKTPLAWAVFWHPTLHSEAEALPPPFRQ